MLSPRNQRMSRSRSRVLAPTSMRGIRPQRWKAVTLARWVCSPHFGLRGENAKQRKSDARERGTKMLRPAFGFHSNKELSDGIKVPLI